MKLINLLKKWLGIKPQPKRYTVWWGYSVTYGPRIYGHSGASSYTAWTEDEARAQHLASHPGHSINFVTTIE